MSDSGIHCQKLAVKPAVTCLAGFNFLLKNESGCQTLSIYCYKTPPKAKSLASHVIFKGAEGSGCTRSVAFASNC